MRRAFLLCLLPLFAAALLPAQTGQIAPNENLIVEAIPPIPAPLAETVKRYTEYRSAGISSWHPTRREMLIGTRFGDTTQVHQVKIPGGARTQLTFFAERVSGASYQPTRGDYFVFSKDIGGNEFYQRYLYDFSSGDVTLLTDGKSRNTGGRWSTGGDRLAYQSTRRTGRDTDIWVMNPAEPESGRLLLEVEGGGWSAQDWSPDDRQLVVRQYLSINETYLWLVDTASGEKTLLTPRRGSEKAAYLGAQFSRDGEGLYVTTDKDSEFRRLVYLDLASKKHTPLSSHIEWDVSSFDLSPDGKTLAFVTNEDGLGVLHLLDTATGEEKPVPELPVGLISGLEWHDNGTDLGFNLSSVRSPSDVYSLNVETGQVQRWTYSETSGLNTESLPLPTLIRWESFDGRMISGFLYRPPKQFTGKRPVIISIHGGPESQARPGFLGSWGYYLNELGIVMIEPNVRGSAGYGKTFLQLDNGFRREDSYKDIEALLDWVETQPDLDADRIMVMGGSYGGFMTLAVATNYADRIRCAVERVGISNLATFLENTKDYRRNLRRAEYGDERDPEMRAFMERIAPLNHADKITKPLFVIQGANDPRVPLSESDQIVGAAKKNQVPVWYLVAKDEGHGFRKKKNRDFQFYSTILFVEKFLLD
jgi:dipeptidyl aminopeptidase/acylaminoacyl peptidase